MPRANRYILPGYIYHLTHRCHDRKFLLRFRIDRNEYFRRLIKAVRKHRIDLFNYSVTCNHVHLLAVSNHLADLSRFVQQLDGEFAEYYNLRKGRTGSFWGDRFHCTIIEGGDHLWNCLRYIDLNMVRAEVVGHPREWRWCGYRELTGQVKRFRLLNTDRLAALLGLTDRYALARIHEQRIAEAIGDKRLIREGIWTECIAVGSESFVRTIASKSRRRKRLQIASIENGSWYVREDITRYLCASS